MKQTMNGLVIKEISLEATPGAEISTAMSDAKRVCEAYECIVTFKFNSAIFRIDQYTDLHEAESWYWNRSNIYDGTQAAITAACPEEGGR